MRSLALTLAVVTGCSSSYVPQSRGRVAVLMKGGKHAYVRDGQIYEHGLLGGGLVEVVQGNPAAMAAANEYHDRMRYGLLAVFGGVAGMLGGTLYLAGTVDPIDDGDNELDADSKLGLGIIATGVVLLIAGSAYFASAEPYRWDAINLFNDTPAPLPPTPRFTTTRTSLQMRD